MPVDFERLRELFIAACDLPPEEQKTFVEKCSDEEMKEELRKLLKSDGTTDGILAEQKMSSGINLPLDLSGQVVGKYKLLQQIGEGGFGLVYMAEQIEPVKRKVALKVVKPGMDTKHALARFEAERQALALMEHPNICRVLDAGATKLGHPYFVMELVKGVAINEYCRRQELPIKDRLRLIQTVCYAVQHAHSKGIIHRDLKPSNVMITFHDTVPVPKIIDFGISKALNQQMTEKTLFTRYGQMLGTPMYMSPEQAEMSGLDIDIRSDVYSLGVLMYELLTDTPPFSEEKLKTASYADLIRIIREEDPPTPSSRLTSLNKSKYLSRKAPTINQVGLAFQIQNDLDRIVMKAMEKDRTRRYATVNELASDIDRYLNDEPVMAGTPSLTYRSQKFFARNRVLVTSIASVMAALLLGLIFATMGFINARIANNRAEAALKDEQHQRNRAEQEEQKTRQALKNEREQRERVEAGLYFQTISRIQRELASSEQLFERCADRFRGWEWNYLKNIANPNVLTMEGMSLPGVTSLTFSPDGELLAAGCYQWLDPESAGNLIIWNADSSGKEVFRLDDLKGGVSSLSFSPDGTRIAAANHNGYGFRVWDIATKNEVASLPQGSFAQVRFSPDGESFAVVGRDRVVRLFDANDGKPIKNLFEHSSSIYGLSFSPNGNLLATTSHDGELIIWDVKSSTVVKRFEASGNRYACFSPDGELLVTTGYETPAGPGGIFVYSVGDSIEHVASHLTSSIVTRANFSPDGQYIIVSGHGGTLQVREPVSGLVVLKKQAHTYRVAHCCFSPNGWKFATSGADRLVKCWDWSIARSNVVSVPDRSFVQGMALAPDGRIATGGGYHQTSPNLGKQIVSVFEFDEQREAECVQQFFGANQWITSLNYSPDGSQLAAVGSQGRITIWDTDIGDDAFEIPQRKQQPAFDLAAHSATANSVLFSEDGRRLFTCGDDGKLLVTDLHNSGNQKTIAELATPINCLDVHPSRKIMVVACENQLVQTWDIESGQQIQTLSEHSSPVTQVAFSPDGQLCVSTDESGISIIWRVVADHLSVQLALVRKLNCHKVSITGVCFSPDQKRLVTNSKDGTTAVWDLATFQEAIRLEPEGQNSNIFSVAFSPDGSQLFSAQGEVITVWDSKPLNQDSGAGRSSAKLQIQWHQQQLSKCLENRNWYGMGFHAERLAQLNPSNADHYVFRGIARINQGLIQAAAADFETARVMGSLNPQLLAHLGMLDIQRDDYRGLQKIVNDVCKAIVTPHSGANIDAENLDSALQVAVLGSRYLDLDSRNAVRKSFTAAGIRAPPLLEYRQEEFESAFLRTMWFRKQDGVDSISNGLIYALSNLQLGDLSAAKVAFEKSVWNWEQISSRKQVRGRPSWIDRSEIESLIDESVQAFGEHKSELFGPSDWINLSRSQRNKVAKLLQDLNEVRLESNVNRAIGVLNQLIFVQPTNWEHYFQRAKLLARSHDDEQRIASAKSDLEEAKRLRLKSAGVDLSSCLMLDGTEYIECPGFPFNQHKKYTVEAWLLGDWSGPLVGQNGIGNDQWFGSYAMTGSYHAMTNQTRSKFGWFHFALVCDGKTNQFYFNGNLTLETKSGDFDKLNKGDQLSIGAFAVPRRFEKAIGAIRSFRFSKTARYENDFEPQEELVVDSDSVVQFDFSDPDMYFSGRITDQSGNQNHGRLIGSWISKIRETENSN